MYVVAAFFELLFWLGAVLLIYVYWGYGALLRLCLRARRTRGFTASSNADPPARLSVTVVLTVHNEENAINGRLDNLLAADYPRDQLEIIVASDGSTDSTDVIVMERSKSAPVVLVRTEGRGKSAAQNEAMRHAKGEIVIFTDAGTLFDARFIPCIVAAFSDSLVGCVTGHLSIDAQPGAVAESQSSYWSYELALRACESDLGILAVASGQAMALRRSLWRPLPIFSGEDCIVPLDVVARRYEVRHCASAHAHDSMPNDVSAELTARIRMTMRNWTGTWLYASLLNPLGSPGYAFALWSHKLLRWLGSLVIVIMTLAGVGLAVVNADYVPLAIVTAAGLAAATGYAGAQFRVSIPVAGMAYGFALANLGFLVGLARALVGRKITRYCAAASS